MQELCIVRVNINVYCLKFKSLIFWVHRKKRAKGPTFDCKFPIQIMSQVGQFLPTALISRRLHRGSLFFTDTSNLRTVLPANWILWSFYISYRTLCEFCCKKNFAQVHRNEGRLLLGRPIKCAPSSKNAVWTQVNLHRDSTRTLKTLANLTKTQDDDENTKGHKNSNIQPKIQYCSIFRLKSARKFNFRNCSLRSHKSRQFLKPLIKLSTAK